MERWIPFPRNPFSERVSEPIRMPSGSFRLPIPEAVWSVCHLSPGGAVSQSQKSFSQRVSEGSATTTHSAKIIPKCSEMPKSQKILIQSGFRSNVEFKQSSTKCSEVFHGQNVLFPKASEAHPRSSPIHVLRKCLFQRSSETLRSLPADFQAKKQRVTGLGGSCQAD